MNDKAPPSEHRLFKFSRIHCKHYVGSGYCDHHGHENYGSLGSKWCEWELCPIVSAWEREKDEE